MQLGLQEQYSLPPEQRGAYKSTATSILLLSQSLLSQNRQGKRNRVGRPTMSRNVEEMKETFERIASAVNACARKEITHTRGRLRSVFDEMLEISFNSIRITPRQWTIKGDGQKPGRKEQEWKSLVTLNVKYMTG